MEDQEKQQIINEERLRWIAFFHYVSGAMTIVFSCMFIFHLIVFGYISSNPEMFNQAESQQAIEGLEIMRVFISILGFLIIAGVVYGICEIAAGVFISKRKYRLFSIIVAIPRILFIPYGAILSIFTLMMLDKESVKQLYDDASGPVKV